MKQIKSHFVKTLSFFLITNMVCLLHASDNKSYQYGEKSPTLEKFVLSWYQNIKNGKAKKYLDSIYWGPQMSEKQILNYKKELAKSSKQFGAANIIFQAGSSSVHEKYAVVYIFFTFKSKGKDRVEDQAWYLIKINDAWKIYPHSIKPKTPKLYEYLRKISKYRFHALYLQILLKKNIQKLK